MNGIASLKHIVLLTGLLALSACGGGGGSGGSVPQPTSLDTSFGSNGTVVTEFYSGNHAVGWAMAIQDDGKVVVAGHADGSGSRDFALVRYNTDGTLDTSFNGPPNICVIDAPCNGILVTDFNGGFDVARAVLIQPDGKIVAAGSAYNGSDNDFALARYNADGTLDTSFGVGGKVTTSFYDSQNDVADAIALQANGQIVVAGVAYNGTSRDFALARYNADGSLDTSFNNFDPFCSPGFICNGKQRADFNGNDDSATAIAIQPDGMIVVAGGADNGTDYDLTLVRYNTDGNLDTGFGSAGTGKVTTPFYVGYDDAASAMALQADGKIVVAGEAWSFADLGFALARYNADGTLDTSFNNQTSCITGNPCSGQQVTDLSDGGSRAYAMAIQPDGKIIAAGPAYNGIDDDFALARYHPDGGLDTGFGPFGTGIAATDFGGANDSAHAIALQADGMIVVAGSTYNGTNFNFALARYLP